MPDHAPKVRFATLAVDCASDRRRLVFLAIKGRLKLLFVNSMSGRVAGINAQLLQPFFIMPAYLGRTF
jgi:hypothetical protein